MNKILGVILVAGLVGITGCKKGSGKLDSTKDKVSYAIGQNIGNTLKMQKIDVDPDIVAASIKEVMAGKESRLTQEQMQEAMKTMQEEMIARQKKEAEENKAKAKDFLDKNQKLDGFKVTKSGLQYKVVNAGKGKTPKDSDTVEVHYKGTLIDGTEFDSSYKRNQTAKFPVKGMIPGWTEALLMMKEGSEWELVIPPDLAYGDRSRPSIPANSVLKFNVKLIKVNP